MAFSLQQFPKRLSRLIAGRFRLVSFLVVALVVVLGYFLFLSPKIVQVREIGVFDLKRTEEQLRLKQDIAAATEALAKKYEELNLDDVQRLKAFLPSSADLPALFVQVEAIALASGLRLDAVGFTELGKTTGRSVVPTEGAGESDEATGPTNAASNSNANSNVSVPSRASQRGTVQKLSVTFSVSGGHGYADLKTFLSNLESSIRLLDVQSLGYTPSEEEEKYTINAVTYYLQP